MAIPIGTLGTIPTLTVGGVVFTDLTNLIILKAYLLTASNHSTMRKVTGSAGYQVTTGKVLTFRAYDAVVETTSSTGPFFSMSYTDNDCGSDSATAPTNQVFEGGAATIARYGTWSAVPTNGAPYQGLSFFQIPSQKYCTLDVKTGTVITIARTYGYEA